MYGRAKIDLIEARLRGVDGPVDFDGPAQRKRKFAADMGLQAHALRIAAEGAVAAYELSLASVGVLTNLLE